MEVGGLGFGIQDFDVWGVYFSLIDVLHLLGFRLMESMSP